MKIKQLLRVFNLRPVEAELYEALFYSGLMTASELARQANIARTAVYDMLKKLTRLGLVTETQKGGVKMFAVQPPEKLKQLIDEKGAALDLAKAELDSFNVQYHAKRKAGRPRVQIFEGKKELEQMMKDMLLYRDLTVRVFWPPDKAIGALGADFFEKFHQERVARNISIQVLWPETGIPQNNKFAFLEAGSKLKREVRLVPSSFNFNFGYAIYGSTVRFISLGKDNLGFLVESRDLAEMMNAQFEMIWRGAKRFR